MRDEFVVATRAVEQHDEPGTAVVRGVAETSL
jgi:hypothetical protein